MAIQPNPPKRRNQALDEALFLVACYAGTGIGLAIVLAVILWLTIQ